MPWSSRLPTHAPLTPLQPPSTRRREKHYTFDHVFDHDSGNKDVYKNTAAQHIPGVLRGFNATVFAYGATGSGKTHTMVGTEEDPGLMILALRDIFREIARDPNSEYTVDCSYLEVYNELIYDLLVPDSPALDLREDPKKGPVVAGLTTTSVENTSEIFAILSAGNSRRKTEPTQMNSVSSRSHAVLQVLVRRYESDEKTKSKMSARLSMVDLAGSERASETKNAGKQLKDGANINR